MLYEDFAGKNISERFKAVEKKFEEDIGLLDQCASFSKIWTTFGITITSESKIDLGRFSFFPFFEVRTTLYRARSLSRLGLA